MQASSSASDDGGRSALFGVTSGDRSPDGASPLFGSDDGIHPDELEALAEEARARSDIRALNVRAENQHRRYLNNHWLFTGTRWWGSGPRLAACVLTKVLLRKEASPSSSSEPNMDVVVLPCSLSR